MTEIIKEQLNQETLWAGQTGERWLKNIDRFEGMIKPIGDALIEQAGCRHGEQIIDVGCGAGATSIEIAQQVGVTGLVTGLDISPVLVAEATKRAKMLGLNHVRFILGDAAVASLPPAQADCLVSRFGVMFFRNPHAAFAHMHGFLKSGGRLSIACWASVLQNSWMLEVRNILTTHFPLLTPIARVPGSFAFSEPAYIEEILQTSGFKEISFSAWQRNLFVGGSGSNPESAAKFLLKALSIAQLPEDLPDSVNNAIHVELSERLEPYYTTDGVQMPASVWLISATA